MFTFPRSKREPQNTCSPFQAVLQIQSNIELGEWQVNCIRQWQLSITVTCPTCISLGYVDKRCIASPVGDVAFLSMRPQGLPPNSCLALDWQIEPIMVHGTMYSNFHFFVANKWQKHCHSCVYGAELVSYPISISSFSTVSDSGCWISCNWKWVDGSLYINTI